MQLIDGKGETTNVHFTARIGPRSVIDFAVPMTRRQKALLEAPRTLGNEAAKRELEAEIYAHFIRLKSVDETERVHFASCFVQFSQSGRKSPAKKLSKASAGEQRSVPDYPAFPIPA